MWPGDEPADGVELELRALLAAQASERQRAAEARSRRKGRGSMLRRALVAADLSGCILALAFVQLFVVQRPAPRDLWIDGLMIVGLVGWVVLAGIYGLCDHEDMRLARSTA